MITLLKPMDFVYPDNVQFKCNSCGLCCGDTKQKTRHILVLDSEIKAISSETCLLPSEFAREILNKEPYRFEMKKGKDGKCFFLRDNQCCIYRFRPLICRFYPFELKFSVDKDAHVFNFTLECPAIGKGKQITRKDFEALFALAHEKLH